MREEFEKLLYIADKLESIYYCENIECYTEKPNYKFCSISTYVNGAWYAFQEQQKKIDAVLNAISQSELHGDRAIWGIQDEIKELLK